jgi:molybdopterin synthase catalytic subunit
MANCECEVALVGGPLSVFLPQKNSGAGAIVEFFGNVRSLENDREIDGIEYEAHREMAEHQLREIAREASERFNLLAIRLHHRVGLVGVGETSLFLRVAAVHRGPAFEASQWIVDQLKIRVPIWKSVRFQAGAAQKKQSDLPVMV